MKKKRFMVTYEIEAEVDEESEEEGPLEEDEIKNVLDEHLSDLEDMFDVDGITAKPLDGSLTVKFLASLKI